MQQKVVYLISNNNMLLSWCSVELGAGYTVCRISRNSSESNRNLANAPAYVLIDCITINELEMFAAYTYLHEEFHCKIIIINAKRTVSAEIKKRLSDAQFVALNASAGTLFRLLQKLENGSVEVPDKGSQKEVEVREQQNQTAYKIKPEHDMLFNAPSHRIEMQPELFEEPITSFDIFSGSSPLMKKFREQVMKAARSDDIVLLLGESGSGKSYTARYIHEHSKRCRNLFCQRNVAELTPTLAESQLFGTERGAFTGAVEKEGLFATANGGTLFLDEIGELALTLQSKLLNVIESRTYRRVGSMDEESFNARLIFATNVDLKKSVSKHAFRKDLFYRIAVLIVKVPSLREHSEDIPYLANKFVTQRGKHLSEPALQKLCAYKWPGNIRELHNILSRACTFCTSTEILSEDIVFP